MRERPIGSLSPSITRGAQATSGARFVATFDGFAQLRLHHGIIIPEPEEYALGLGLLALGFVLFHRRRMQKKQHQ